MAISSLGLSELSRSLWITQAKNQVLFFLCQPTGARTLRHGAHIDRRFASIAVLGSRLCQSDSRNLGDLRSAVGGTGQRMVVAPGRAQLPLPDWQRRLERRARG